MIDIKLLAQFMSKPENFKFVNDSPNDLERRKRIEILKTQFEKQSGNFSRVNFSADIEDVGNEEFSFLNDEQFNFAAFNSAAKAQTGLQTIKRIVATHNVRDSVRAYALQRNESIRAANKIAEAKKAKKKSSSSSPFWY